MSDIKQVIVIRKDLKMRRGKEIAQGSHSSMAFIQKRLDPHPRDSTDNGMQPYQLELTPQEREWFVTGTKKVCLQIDTLPEMIEILHAARDAGLEAHMIIDSGFTEFAGQPTPTCVAIGPDNEDVIDLITRDLKLY